MWHANLAYVASHLESVATGLAVGNRLDPSFMEELKLGLLPSSDVRISKTPCHWLATTTDQIIAPVYITSKRPCLAERRLQVCASETAHLCPVL